MKINTGALLKENFKIAIASIRTNMLRTVLTICIIAFGIMALVGIQTAIDSIKHTIADSFSQMGTLSFTITRQTDRFRMSNQHERKRGHEYVSFNQSTEFKKAYREPAYVSLSTNVSGTATIKYESEQTNPNVRVMGVDELYLSINSLDIETGRNFSGSEIEYGSNVAVVGDEIVKSVLKNQKSILGKDINVNGVHYSIIGVLKNQGATSSSGNRQVLIPLTSARNYFPSPNQNYKIQVLPYKQERVNEAMSEAEGLFRTIRRISPADPVDFDISRSDAMAQEQLEFMKYPTIAAFIIGIITLLGAAVGLMNIMLVSVTERTREIGTRKAIGAKSSTIKQQFLFEAILIGQLGGALGIALGVLAGNSVSLLTSTAFVVPWLWIIVGVGLCFLVSVLSGYLPAVKAARLDPIEALRYE